MLEHILAVEEEHAEEMSSMLKNVNDFAAKASKHP
jgi:hypothetical protein